MSELPQEGAPTGKTAVQGQGRPMLPLCRKVCYAIGGSPYQMTGSALGFFLQIFLLDVAQLKPFHVSLILFLGQAWDAVTDPAIGFLVSRSPRRKLGKLIPWIAFSMPFGVTFYCMLWFVPFGTTRLWQKCLWYLVMYCCFQTCKTCYHVPYSSLTMFLGGSQRDRDSATAYRPLGPLEKAKIPFFRSLRVILAHRSYTHLLCAFILASLAFQVAQGIFAFYCTHASGMAGRFQHLVLIMLVTASLSIPVWQCMLVRFGKKTVLVGLSIIIPALIVITQVTHNFPVFVVMVIMAGCSLGVLYLLPWSMLPDAVDDFRLKNPKCLNLEAFFYSFYVFFNKFAGGLALGISTMSLHFAGYKAGDCTHNPSVILTLKILMAPVPIILLLASMVTFYFYPINEERRRQMKVEMEAVEQGRRENANSG
ncbi:PREDICTED: sodium-dependent lysophosphatidylcholine symporter 1-like isoform X3 [Gavialis gangeticus]|uniref:sodium-dependent lysophosphatidylcholine symporter 1-like isoform X3 n=1 Tax=Gavialis gangeticus TaxID=94835 RepID=UPI00092FAC15|nr:PREDICTED: sodium-dependent lysophosphatidylcholine symporter 1-like isoform X3 [Gavialis gangeticus]